jgi:Domain of unknown function (DUF4416)
MSTPGAPKPVKLFAGLLASEKNLFATVEEELAAVFGPVDAGTEAVPWTVSDYYAPEMGAHLLRRFVSFARSIAPEMLPDAKLTAQEIERRHRGERGGRRINIDPGYLDLGKVVLASSKAAGHRMYLRGGIYAEMTLLYHSGGFQPFVYTYADYVWPDTTAFLTEMRARYLDQLKENDGR